MNDNSSTNRAQSRIPSDDQTDSLLRDFFRREVPAELNQPLRRSALATATAAAATLALASDHHVEHLRPRSARFVGVAASVAAMALAVLVLISGKAELPSNGSGFAGRETRPPATTPDTDEPMLVSPQGDSRTSTKVVGPDGVTLEETDSIELHPQKQQ